MRPHATGGSRALPFEGLRILDMTSFWAGPLTGHTLALLGAEVIHLESATRPDGARLSDRDQIATPAQFDLIEALESYAAQRGVSLLDVAIGGLLADEVVSTVIAGATKPEQVHANASAARWIPAGDDLTALQQVLADHPV